VKHGIYLHNASSNNITLNLLYRNTAGTTGLHADADTDNNEIHRNCFVENDPQAHDEGVNNNWDSNYWSDYYEILPYYPIEAGSSGSQDNNPLGECPFKYTLPPTTCGMGGDVLPVSILALLAPHICRSGSNSAPRACHGRRKSSQHINLLLIFFSFFSVKF